MELFVKARTLLILRAMTKCNHMEGRKDGWYFLRNEDYEFGPISSDELRKLQEEGLIHGVPNVDRWLVTTKGWIKLQERSMVPDSVAYTNSHNIQITSRLVEPLT